MTSRGPMGLDARAERLIAAGAKIEDVSGGTGVVGAGGDLPAVVPRCAVTLADGRRFEAGGPTHDEAMAAAFAQAEAALGID